MLDSRMITEFTIEIILVDESVKIFININKSKLNRLIVLYINRILINSLLNTSFKKQKKKNKSYEKNNPKIILEIFSFSINIDWVELIIEKA